MRAFVMKKRLCSYFVGLFSPHQRVLLYHQLLLQVLHYPVHLRHHQESLITKSISTISQVLRVHPHHDHPQHLLDFPVPHHEVHPHRHLVLQVHHHQFHCHHHLVLQVSHHQVHPHNLIVLKVPHNQVHLHHLEGLAPKRGAERPLGARQHNQALAQVVVRRLTRSVL